MDAPATAVPAHQRARGRAELVLAPAAGGARLRHLFQAAPLRLLFPDTDPGDPTLGAFLNVAGGLAGGDTLETDLVIEPRSRFTATTPAVEKIYRSLGPETDVANTLRLGDDSVCEWLPQETILFDGARLARTMQVDLSPTAHFLAAEMLVFGRAARGERFLHGSLRDAWRIRRDGKLVWADTLAIGDPVRARQRFALGEAGAMATLLLAGPAAEARRDALRELSNGGASRVAPGLLVARWLGEAGAVRRGLGAAIAVLRQAAFGHPPRLPRLWRS
jgi:urease accessory protein